MKIVFFFFFVRGREGEGGDFMSIGCYEVIGSRFIVSVILKFTFFLISKYFLLFVV